MIKNAIRRWLGLAGGGAVVVGQHGMPLQIDSLEDPPPILSMVVHQTLNGRIIQIGRFKHNPHGPDWSYRIYIVPAEQSLPDAFATCMVLYGHDFS